MKNLIYPWRTELKELPCCPPEELIKVDNLSLSYNDKPAFKNISLNLQKGCISGIIGPSGCGKSSFLQCLNRMHESFNHTKIKGQISFNGVSLFDSKHELSLLRKKIGIVFQEPSPLPLSIIDNLKIALREHKFDHIEERAQNALKDVGLWEEVKEKLHSSASELSGGQKQRLCIARALALEPEVLLMDEPCSSLDPISTDKIEKLILSLKGKYTILLVTHNLAQARRICDHLFAFWFDEKESCGQLIESGTTASIFERPKSPIVRDYIGGVKG